MICKFSGRKKKKRKEERTFSFLEFLPVDGRRHSIIGQRRSKDSLTKVSMTWGRIYILVQHHQNLNGIINNPKPMTSTSLFQDSFLYLLDTCIS